MAKINKIDGNSLNPQNELAELLKSQFPQVFADGKIDGDKLKKALGEELDTNNERYGLTWAGKNECFRHIQETTTATLRISDLKFEISERREEKRISERRDLRSQISDLRKRAQIWNLRRREENLRFEI
jgi:hypothetical protein